jgi:hypothetical protein
MMQAVDGRGLAAKEKRSLAQAAFEQVLQLARQR